jgi:hypothetical protein
VNQVKTNHLHVKLGALLLSVVGSFPVHAALHDRGGGLIYDDVLDVTWLQDATYVMTSGAATYSQMSWTDAVEYAANLTYYDPVRDMIWGDWRLPRTLPVNGIAYQSSHSIDGSTDNGFNISSPASELGYMFYVNLGGLAFTDTVGNWPQPGYGSKEYTGPFTNLDVIEGIWSGTEYEQFPGHAWSFIFNTGTQHHGIKSLDTALSPWPVRDGDVAAGPLPVINAAPASGSVVSGTVSIGVQVTNMQVQAVRVQVADKTLCKKQIAAFRCQWNTKTVANGEISVLVYAIDVNNNRKSKRINFTVNNP